MEAIAPIEASEPHKKLGYKHDCPKCHCSLGFKEKKWGVSCRGGHEEQYYMKCANLFVDFAGKKSTGLISNKRDTLI